MRCCKGGFEWVGRGGAGGWNEVLWVLYGRVGGWVGGFTCGAAVARVEELHGFVVAGEKLLLLLQTLDPGLVGGWVGGWVGGLFGWIEEDGAVKMS